MDFSISPDKYRVQHKMFTTQNKDELKITMDGVKDLLENTFKDIKFKEEVISGIQYSEDSNEIVYHLYLETDDNITNLLESFLEEVKSRLK